MWVHMWSSEDCNLKQPGKWNTYMTSIHVAFYPCSIFKHTSVVCLSVPRCTHTFLNIHHLSLYIKHFFMLLLILHICSLFSTLFFHSFLPFAAVCISCKQTSCLQLIFQWHFKVDGYFLTRVQYTKSGKTLWHAKYELSTFTARSAKMNKCYICLCSS